jgi:hypothetical protein
MKKLSFKPFFKPFLRFKYGQAFVFGVLFLFLSGSITPGFSLIRIDKESIDLALRYGMTNQGLGLRNLLGENWIEGSDGVLLNIYTPFMMLASKAYHGNFPEEPSDADVKKARNRYARLISTLSDPHYKNQVKFSVSLYGDTPEFAGEYRARIEGFGRGRNFAIKPDRELRQKVATQDPEAKVKPYEAINAYYFDFNNIVNLEDYQFIIESPGNPPITFRIRNDRIH